VGVNLSKVTKNKEKMSFGFKHGIFSFALTTYNDLQPPNFPLTEVAPPLHFQVLSVRLFFTSPPTRAPLLLNCIEAV
jgi:hypothetical protein